MYTDNFEEEILFIPARKDGEACNHLKLSQHLLMLREYQVI
ncbi:hypothetical protein [Catenibacterium sp.]